MKRAFYIGVILGGILGIAVALSMDLLLGKSLGGGWGEAVANDLNNLFKANLSPKSFIVIIGVIIVVGIIGAFGSFIGGMSLSSF
ncbi:hypothetical protein JZK55_06570 [Dissulfurispira thermophila]|uniref:Uncharacterized protein n=1 Tax=Dissulfurispira thermophila TaxID=2715679 RepID=A0A7G1GZ28_9BACT|nr:hypothetical protein [Dissulfurispira thermophila]BCB95735.1 hypothetical protein JZK55_06570 [Dissulfurispira thermophila]